MSPTLNSRSYVNFGRGIFGIRKWQFGCSDDIDLLCEICIFSNCSWSRLCRVCKKYLRWCLELLQDRWNTEKYIDFYDALQIVRDNKKPFCKSLKFEYWRKEHIIQLISKKK